MKIRRGLLRLAVGAEMVWFAYWTFAYVLVPRASENHVVVAPSFSPATDVALAVTTMLAVAWIAFGFRSE